MIVSGRDSDMPAPMTPASPVPPQRSRAYYVAKYAGHRLQASLAWQAAGGRAPAVDGVRILAYHRVCNARDDLAVAPADFRRQMEAVLSTGARAVSLTDAVEALEQRSGAPLVCITFDDGYHDNLDEAIPVLRELGVPATIFASTELIAGNVRLYWYRAGKEPPLLSFDELAEIGRDPLFDIGAHTRTHPALPSLPDEAAWDEIAGSKHELEERLGRPVATFAYPAGLHSPRDLRLVREAGYRAGVTTEPGANRPGQPPEALHRMFIDGHDTPRMFEAKLAGLLDRPWGIDRLQAARGPARSTSS
jgi:peptidoglycan/xylan/chitin deacetylase (PgdA/CDA1 family)